jgi:hypothetical protein
MRRPLASLPGRSNPTVSGDAADLSIRRVILGAAAALPTVKPAPLLTSGRRPSVISTLLDRVRKATRKSQISAGFAENRIST